MTKQGDLQRLIKVKRALADKYDRMARNTNSRPRRAAHYRRASSYRHQVADAQALLPAGRRVTKV